MLLNELSDDILFELFDKLKQVEDLLILSQTCKLFNKIEKIEEIWRNRIIRDFDLTSYMSLKGPNFRQRKFKELYRALRNPQVFVWGDKDDGRLGIPSQELYSYGPRYGEIDYPVWLKSLAKVGVSTVVCGGFMMLALTHTNKVYFWGTFNSRTYSTPSSNRVDEPTLLDVFPENSKIHQIACGRTHALALAKDGAVYLLDNPVKKPTCIKVEGNESKIVQIACGFKSSLVLTSSHNVYMWRFEDDSSKYFYELIFYGLVDGEYIVKIAGGDKFALGLTNLNRVVKWIYNFDADLQNAEELNDYNSDTEVSEDNDDTEQIPETDSIKELILTRRDVFTGYIMKEVKDVKMLHITAQFESFGLFDDEGRFWTGKHPSNTVNDMDTDVQLEPSFESESGNPIQVSFGDWHRAILTDTGNLFTYGEHALGRGPGVVDLGTHFGSLGKVEYFNDLFVFYVACAGWHTVALAVDLNNPIGNEPPPFSGPRSEGSSSSLSVRPGFLHGVPLYEEFHPHTR